jgi:hypothetical protein
MISLCKTTPKGIRTPVTGLKTRCPRPLDDGGTAANFNYISRKYRTIYIH